MKAPRFEALTKSEQIACGINTFAGELLAESYTNGIVKFGGTTVMLETQSHRGTPVYIIMSTEKPELEQFRDWPK